MNDHKAKSIGALIESFHIFAKFAEKGYQQAYVLNAEHDIIYGPENPPQATLEGQRLEALGWYWDDDVESWAMFT